ncbi:MAG: hypothetical protein M1492_04900 [Gammaproteobacteria bacterium]|nr:hypothetical protein [Gammaproteobacteria bacterium]
MSKGMRRYFAPLHQGAPLDGFGGRQIKALGHVRARHGHPSTGGHEGALGAQVYI